MPKITLTEGQLAESEQRLRDGDNRALMDVLYYYILRGIRIPIWVTVKFFEAYAEVYDGHASSWDDVFGKPWPRRHLDDLRGRKELAMRVYARIEQLRGKNEPVGDGLFETVAKEFEVGTRQVKELYYDVKTGVPNSEGDAVGSDECRELGILNAKPPSS